MKERIRFYIPSVEDRSNLISILATAGYPVVLKKETVQSGIYDKTRYFVAVLEDAKDGEG